MKQQNIYFKYGMTLLVLFCFSLGILISITFANIFLEIEIPKTISFESYLLIMGFAMLGLFEVSKNERR